MRSMTQGYSALSLCVLLALPGCVVDSSKLKAPSAHRSVVLATGLAPDRVFQCAESTLERLHQQDNHWVRQITRKDSGAGVLETGNFPEENEMGFRLSARLEVSAGRVALSFKGAGPYFTDLGVESAAQKFADGLSQCLQSPSK